MAHYYQQAILTVSALAIVSSRSILAPRAEIPFHSLIKLPYRNCMNVEDGFFYNYRSTSQSSEVYRKDVRESILLSRGWVFQEWFLSRRIIYYTPRELFFECQTDCPRGERGQGMITTDEERPALRTQFKSKGFESWYELVQLYSKSHLTRPERDHIVALSGVAKEFRAVIEKNGISAAQPTSLRYASGLWLEDIHHGLLWHGVNTNQRTCGCGAPSWSWAARLGEVKWFSRATKCKKVLEILLPSHTSSGRSGQKPAGQTEPGELSGTLGLRGSVDQAVRGVEMVTKPGLTEDYGLWKDDSDCQRAGDWRMICSLSNPDIIGGWALFEDPSLVDGFSDCDGFSAPALHVSTRKKIAPGGRVRSQAMGMYHDVYDVLFLEPQGDDAFRRIGVGRIMDKQIMHAFATSELKKMTLT